MTLNAITIPMLKRYSNVQYKHCNVALRISDEEKTTYTL